MIKAEKTKDGFRVEAKGGGAVAFIGELLEATSSIFAEIIRDDMTEAETDEFYKSYMDSLKQETKNKKERIKRNDPSLRKEVKKTHEDAMGGALLRNDER